MRVELVTRKGATVGPNAAVERYPTQTSHKATPFHHRVATKRKVELEWTCGVVVGERTS